MSSPASPVFHISYALDDSGSIIDSTADGFFDRSQPQIVDVSLLASRKRHALIVPIAMTTTYSISISSPIHATVCESAFRDDLQAIHAINPGNSPGWLTDFIDWDMQGKTSGMRFSPVGFVLNAIVLLGGWFVFRSIRLVWTNGRSLARVARGTCPTCGYPGIDRRGHPCTECGTRVVFQRHP